MAMGYFLMPTLLAAQASPVVSAARRYLWLVLLYGLVGFPHALLRGKNDLVVWNALKLAPPLGWLTVLLLAGALGKATPESLAAGYLVAVAALVFPFLLVVRLRVSGPFRPEPRQSPALLRYGLPSLVGATPRLLNMRLDQLLMATFLAPHSLGLYAVAVAWSGAMAPLLNAVRDALFPHVASQEIAAHGSAFHQIAYNLVATGGHFASGNLLSVVDELRPSGARSLLYKSFHSERKYRAVQTAALIGSTHMQSNVTNASTLCLI